jgi:glucose/arabinose dehydrogenase/PKD repeat protein
VLLAADLPLEFAHSTNIEQQELIPLQIAAAPTEAPFSLAGFSDEAVFSSGLNQPIAVEFLPDGRMLIAEKVGRIWIADPNSGAKSLYLTLPNIDSGQERGLLDLVVSADFDPSAPGDDYLYLYYTPATPKLARIARFTHEENDGGLSSRASTASELEVWHDTEGYLACCHYGGGLDIGPDGKLWLTTSDKFTTNRPGEGSSTLNLPQDLTSAAGKVIRVNLDGTVPAGTDGWPANPFVDPVDDDPALPGSQDYYDYIWAYGLRNPFRASWDLPTEQFFIAEVGGNVQSFSIEDIHIATLDRPAANFGWPDCEGGGALSYGTCPPDISAPVFSYPHAMQGASVTGGEVYRGDQFPQEWQGAYFYGDFSRDFIRYLTFDDNRAVTGDYALLPTTELPADAPQIVHLTVGTDGALYYTLIGGQIHRVTHSNGNRAPQITSTQADQTSGGSPLEVNFTAAVSDAENDSLSYEWVFGDGTSTSGAATANAANATHTYTQDGLYGAYVAISDGSQTTYSGLIQVQVGTANAPPTVDEFAAAPQAGEAPLAVSFIASVSDLEGDPLTYELFFGDGSSTGILPVPAGGDIDVDHTYLANGGFDAFLVVSDGQFSTQSDSISVAVGTPQAPPVTDGLVLLLESDIKVGLTNGTTIASWLDGSGQGNNLDAAGDPQLVAGMTPGGRPGILLDGDGDKLERTVSQVINGLPTGNSNRSIFVVANYLDPLGALGGVAYGDGVNNGAFGLAADGATGNLAVVGGGTTKFVANAAGEGAGWMTHAVVLNSNFATQYKDGVQIDSDPHLFSTDLAAATSTLVLGEEIGGAGFSEVAYGAVLVYDRAVTTAERQQIEAYLHSKYFIGNLPPVANDDSALVANGGKVRIDVTANDFDSDGVLNPASVTIVAGPSSGTVTIDPATGAVTYQHNSSSTTSDSFTYTIDDEIAVASNIATVSISVGTGTLVTDGLVLQLESDAGVTDEGGGVVTAWLDSSGLGNDLQTVVGDPELVAGTTPSGQAAVRLDGDDGLARIGASDPLNGLPSGGADRTVFLVAQYDAANAFGGFAYGKGTFNDAFGLVVNGAAGKLTVQGWGPANDLVSTSPGVGAGWLVQSVVLSADNVDHFSNGGLIDSRTHAFTTALDKVSLAQEIAGSGFADMDVAAVLVYDRALLESERQQVQAYLHSKYLALPVGPPVFTSDADVSVTENSIVAAALETQNPIGVTYAVTGGADQDSFEIGGFSGNELRFIVAPDFENPGDDDGDRVYEVQITATNAEGSAVQNMTVSVTDVAPPQFTSPANVNLPENNRLVQTLAVSDPTGVVFSLTGGDDQALFTLSGNGDELTFDAAPDFEMPGDSDGDNIYEVQATATSPEGTVAIDLQINITDVVELGCNVPGNPVLCLDANTNVVFDAQTGLVSQWGDASGRGNDLVAVGTARPVVGVIQTPSGQGAIRFDGVDDELVRTSAEGLVSLPSGNADRTLVLVAQFHDAAAWGGASYGRGAFNRAFGVGVVGDGANEGNLFVQGWGGVNDLVSTEQGFDPVSGTSGWVLLSVVHTNDGTDPADNTVLYLNGAPIAAFSHAYNTTNTHASSRIVVGSEIAGLGHIQLDVAAWLVYDTALDATARQNVESFLTARFLTPPSDAPGDFDSDGDADGRDFLAWQRGFGTAAGATRAQGDSDADGDVDNLDLADWETGFGTGSPSALAAVVSASSEAGLATDLGQPLASTTWLELRGRQRPATRLGLADWQPRARSLEVRSLAQRILQGVSEHHDTSHDRAVDDLFAPRRRSGLAAEVAPRAEGAAEGPAEGAAEVEFDIALSDLAFDW